MTKESKIQTFFIESLGCAKNTVDAHAMEKFLSRSGYVAVADSKGADVIIVNTCGFINPAREESLQVLNEYAENKKTGQFLVAAGCLSEREKGHLTDSVKGLDAALSTRRWSDIVQVIRKLDEGEGSTYLHFPEAARIQPAPDGIPAYAVQGKSAYLKIADGCDRRCSYCAIPLIKGPMVSRKQKFIIEDAKQLADMGVQEIILIAQDSTAYGRDLGLKDGLPVLLESLASKVPSIPWTRIMYTFPGSISSDLISVMGDLPQVLPYLDLPLQHASPAVLKSMHRPSDMGQVRETLHLMREKMPDLALRTTFIVGFPGETEKDFQMLLDFTREIRFDHVGIFPYYHEQGTNAYDLKDEISEKDKTARMEELAKSQETISLQKNQEFIGKEMQILVEENGDDISIGRSYRDAPEIDGLVFLQQIIKPGSMVSAHITGALIHDLIGNVV